MKEVKFKKIEIRDFKSQTRTVVFGAHTTSITGENGSGKTTIYKAAMWCLTGYTDAINGKNHELYDNRFEQSQYTPAAQVVLTVEVNGREVPISRSAKPKFVRKRGSEVYEKAGSDDYKYMIDDIEYNNTDFNAWIENNICSSDLLPFCLGGDFFSVLAENDKNKARKVLTDILGEPSDTELTGDYSSIAEDLESYSVDEIKSKYKNRIKPLSQRLSEIPALIAEKNRMAADVLSVNYDSVTTEISEKQKRLEEIETSLAQTYDEAEMKSKEEAVKRLNDIKEKYNDEFSEYTRKFNEETIVLRTQLAEINAYNKEQEAAYNAECEEKRKAEGNLALERKALGLLEKERNELRLELLDAKGMVFSEDSCPYCGQRLSDEKLESLLEDFNKKKADRIERIVEQGTMIAEKIRKAEEEIKSLEEKANKEIAQPLLKDTCEIKEKMETRIVPFNETERGIELNNAMAEIVSTEPTKKDNSALLEEKAQIQERIAELNQVLGKKSFAQEQAEKYRNEAVELSEEQRRIGSEIAANERIIATVAKYSEEKADLLSRKVNDGVSSFKVVMYEIQKNGEKTPSLTITSPEGIKLSTINNSKRLRILAEIQRMFCRLLDINIPCFIDECSVFDSKSLPAFEGTQMVYLKCSDDAQLKIETK